MTVLVLLSCTSFCRGIDDLDVKALTPIQGLVFFCWSHQNLLLSKAKMMKLQQWEEMFTSKRNPQGLKVNNFYVSNFVLVSNLMPCMFGVARLKMMHVTLWDPSNYCSMKMWRLHFPISFFYHIIIIKSVPPCALCLLWEGILGLLCTLGNTAF